MHTNHYQNVSEDMEQGIGSYVPPLFRFVMNFVVKGDPYFVILGITEVVATTVVNDL